jgi:transposase
MNQRRALAPLEINRSYGQELSPYQRGQISAYKAVGLTNQQISENLHCGKTTVFDNLVKNPLRNNGHSLSRKGRPPALNRTQKRNILRVIRSNPKITYQALKLEVGVEVHRTTLYRMLKDEGITNWISKKRPLLTSEHAAKRLAWCLKRKNWTWTEWSKIIFSDECSLERGSGGRRSWVFRTPHQR